MESSSVMIRKFISVTPLLFLLTVSTLFAQREQASGFFTLRSQSPIQQLRVGIQHHPPWTVPQGRWALQIQHTWKNMWLYKKDTFLIDGEIHETVVRGSYGMAESSLFEIDKKHLEYYDECIDHTYGMHDAQPQVIMVPKQVATAMSWLEPSRSKVEF